MNASFISSELTSGKRNHKCYIATSSLIYQATVYGEDDEQMSFEVEADSYAEACAIAENRANDSMINISYIDVACMG